MESTGLLDRIRKILGWCPKATLSLTRPTDDLLSVLSKERALALAWGAMLFSMFSSLALHTLVWIPMKYALLLVVYLPYFLLVVKSGFEAAELYPDERAWPPNFKLYAPKLREQLQRALAKAGEPLKPTDSFNLYGLVKLSAKYGLHVATTINTLGSALHFTTWLVLFWPFISSLVLHADRLWWFTLPVWLFLLLGIFGFGYHQRDLRRELRRLRESGQAMGAG